MIMDKNTRNQIVQIAAGSLTFVLALTLNMPVARPYIFFASYAILGWEVVLKAVTNIFRGKLFNLV